MHNRNARLRCQLKGLESRPSTAAGFARPSVCVLTLRQRARAVAHEAGESNRLETLVLLNTRGNAMLSSWPDVNRHSHTPNALRAPNLRPSQHALSWAMLALGRLKPLSLHLPDQPSYTALMIVDLVLRYLSVQGVQVGISSLIAQIRHNRKVLTATHGDPTPSSETRASVRSLSETSDA